MHFCVTSGTQTCWKGSNDELLISSLSWEVEGTTGDKIRQRAQIKEGIKVRRRKLDHKSFPRVRVPRQEVSAQGEMPMTEVDLSVRGFGKPNRSWASESSMTWIRCFLHELRLTGTYLNHRTCIISTSSPANTDAHMQPQRVASRGRFTQIVSMCTVCVCACVCLSCVLVWDFSQTMQKEELHTVYKSKDLLWYSCFSDLWEKKETTKQCMLYFCTGIICQVPR